MTESIHVACLCAAWCRLCDDYVSIFEQVAAELDDAGLSPKWHWIDIEDEADLVGDMDVDTFPTLVIADRDHVRFAGALTPQPETLRRVARATIAGADPGAAHWPAVSPAIEAFAERLRRHAAKG
jgi:thiol-disulfide isomerase/thioredoxin